MLESLRQDLEFAARLLRRDWATTVLTVACLAIGIGATTTMFSVANAILIRAMPFRNGERLYSFSTRHAGDADVNGTSYPDYLDWRARQRSFAELAAYGPTSFVVALAEPVRVPSALVSANFFRTLGVVPVRGRLFVDGEDRLEANPVAIVARGFAERQLGGLDRAVGSTLEIRGQPRTVVGVVPDDEVLPARGEVWLPLPRDLNGGRANRNLEVIGLIRPGVPVARARTEISSIQAQLGREYPESDALVTATTRPLRERFVAPARQALIAMSVAALLVLLVACANVAGIQLARGTSRVREIAVRTAIGASRLRVVQQLLTESVVVAMAGGALGVAIAYQSCAFASRSVLGPSPDWLSATLDGRVLAFAVIASMVTGVAFGVAPALHLARVAPADVLRAGSSAGGSGQARLQQIFVGGEIALSIVLLVAAGLSIESVRRVQRVPLGFDHTGLLIFNVTLQDPHYDERPADRERFASELLRRGTAIPGVHTVGATSLPPLRCCSPWRVRLSESRDADELLVSGTSVTPGYFAAMGIGVVRGRAFTSSDGANSPPVIVINETFAKRYWPSGDAIGRTVVDGADRAAVIGVVRDVKQGGLLDDPQLQAYRPLAQKGNTTLTFAWRIGDGNVTTVADAARRIVRDLDPTLAVYDVTTMAARVDNALVARRTFESLMLVFGAVALVLASFGLFAVTSFVVARRTRELALRAALGAGPTQLQMLVLRGTLGVTGCGAAIGLTFAVVAARWLSATLYGVRVLEPAVYVMATATVAVATLLASYAPARRAASAEPMMTLRTE